MWEEFGEAMKQNFESAPKKFWQTIWWIRRGKWNPVHTAFSVGGELLTSTESIVQWWKEYFEDRLNPTKTHFKEEGDLEGLGSHITGVEVAGAVK